MQIRSAAWYMWRMPRLRRPRGRPGHPDSLTPAEWAVVELVRDGPTNAEIAVRRGVGPETEKSQVASILGKLSLMDRRALATWEGRPGAATPSGERWWSVSALFGWLALFTKLPELGLGLAPVAIGGTAIGGVAVVVLVSSGDDAETQRIVFARSESDRPADIAALFAGYAIYVMNRDGSQQTRLTDHASGDYWPAWSPDGSRIAFHSGRDGNLELYVMHADGSNQARLTANDAVEGWPSWSPDGSRIVFSSDRHGNPEIFVIDSDGSGLVRLTETGVVNFLPACSPDGSRIACASNRDGNVESYVMNADGSDVTRLTNSLATDHTPAWSPGGTRIAFKSERDGQAEIYIMNADGSDVTRLTKLPRDRPHPSLVARRHPYRLQIRARRPSRDLHYERRRLGSNPLHLEPGARPRRQLVARRLPHHLQLGP